MVFLVVLLSTPNLCCLNDMADSPKASFDLANYQGKNWLLLLFASSAKSPAYAEQLEVLEGEEKEVEEHDLLLGHVLEKGKSRLAGQALSEADVAGLRERFDVGAEAFQVLLVGKDGTEKYRGDTPIKSSAIFKKIDAEPMQQ